MSVSDMGSIFRKIEGFKKKEHRLFFEVDAEEGVFESEQCASILNVGEEGVRRFYTFLNGELEVDRLDLRATEDGSILSGWGCEVFDILEWGRPAMLLELRTAEPVMPGDEVELELGYHMRPGAFLDEPRKMYDVTVSPFASYAIAPFIGHYPLFSSNVSPFELTIRYPEGNLSCVPGALISSRTERGCIIDLYRCDTPNIPTFSVAPYEKKVREKGGVSFEFYLYPDQAYVEEMFDGIFRIPPLYFDSFGDPGTRVFKVGVVGAVNTGEMGGESKGNTIYCTDRVFRRYVDDPDYRVEFMGYMAHEIFHNWNDFYVFFSGNLSMWWEEGGANFIQAWTLERLVGLEAAAAFRRGILERHIQKRGAEAKRTLFELTDKFGGPEENSLMYHYGMFVWEQLRQRLGDDGIFGGLGKFFREHGHKEATYRELFEALQEHADVDVEAFLGPWITRNALIDMSIEGVSTTPSGAGYETEIGVGVSANIDSEIFTEVGYRASECGALESVKIVLEEGEKSMVVSSEREPVVIQLDPYHRVPLTNLDNMIWTAG